MFCSSSRWLRAAVAFPFSVFSSSIERFSPVINHDLISNCTRKHAENQKSIFLPSWLSYVQEHVLSPENISVM